MDMYVDFQCFVCPLDGAAVAGDSCITWPLAYAAELPPDGEVA